MRRPSAPIIRIPPEASTIWHNSTFRTRQVPRGRALFKRALAIREKAFGADHPSPPQASTIWRPLPNKANTRRPSLSTNAPWPSMRRPSALITRIPPQVSTVWHISTTHKASTPRPSRFYKRALAIREKALGSDHPYTAEKPQLSGALYARKTSTPMPSLSTNAPWLLLRKPSAPIIHLPP